MLLGRKTMKKMILFLALMSVLAIVGCKKSTACWYPIDGGHINLDQVKVISSEAELLAWYDDNPFKKDTLINGAINKESIKAAIDKIKSNSKDYERINYQAKIIFDNFPVKLQTMDDHQYFPNGWTSNKDLIKLLELWLDAKKDVDSML